VQLSSTLLPTNRLWTLSRFKSKSKSNRHLSSNAFSRSFPPNQTHRHESFPQGRESLCVHPHQQAATSCPPSHMKIASNLKLKYLESTPPSLNPKLRPTDPNQYPIQVFCRIFVFLLMWVREVTPTLYIIRCSAFRLFESTTSGLLPPLILYI